MAEVSFTTLEKLMSQGKELGYTGEELRKFVETQQNLEKEERVELRRLEIESKKMDMELENRRAEAERFKMEASLRERELYVERQRLEMGFVRGSGSTNGVELGRFSGPPKPKLPKFNEREDSIDT